MTTKKRARKGNPRAAIAKAEPLATEVSEAGAQAHRDGYGTSVAPEGDPTEWLTGWYAEQARQKAARREVARGAR